MQKFESKKALVAGAGGFIGGHIVLALEELGIAVTAVDIKPKGDWFQVSPTATNLTADLSDLNSCRELVPGHSWVLNLAADMGGMGFIELNKARTMLSSLINTHLLLASRDSSVERFFFSSSACVYPSWLQDDSDEVRYLKESDAYPADPEDGYGWEKLFSERMCRHFMEDFGLEVRVARFHNVFGPFGTFEGGREKAPAAACRKVAEFALGRSKDIEIWGNGEQKRSFTFIDDCVEGVIRLMDCDYSEPINIGSAETVSVSQLYETVASIAGVKKPRFSFVKDAPLGVQARSSDNHLVSEVLSWAPAISLEAGLSRTYPWIYEQLES